MSHAFPNEPEHPLLPLPTDEEAAAIVSRPGGVQELGEVLEWRRDVIARANSDPLFHELEPDFWADARQCLVDRIRVLILLGGNRSGKSRVCGKMVMEALVKHPGTTILCVSEDETASRETQQSILWHYLPNEYKALRGKRDPLGVFYVNYSVANGFSERRLILPNRSKLLLATYNEEPDQYEGMMWGNPTVWTIGWWADENLRLAWLKMLRRRGRFQPGTGLWSYTPIRGMTPTIKEAVGDAPKTLRHRPAKLLPDRVNVPGLPPGTMPYIQVPFLDGARVIYFHSEMSPFGPGPNGTGKPFAESVAEDCAGKPSEYIQRIAYGYTLDVAGKAFPLFSPIHVVAHEHVPAEGTNFMFVDPAGRRNWFTIWVRVSPGNPPTLWIYRDWPDEQSYGEWAVPTERATTMDSRKGWDGDEGPAQTSLGFGHVQYKELWAKLEAGEKIEQRYVDPRAGRNAMVAEKGGTCIVDDFYQEQKGPDGKVVGPSVELIPASGVDIEEGLGAVNALLWWDRSRPFDAVLNSPRLFVSERCRQVIWVLSNYTGRGGDTAASKDPADVLRYMALAQLYYKDPARPFLRPGGGGY